MCKIYKLSSSKKLPLWFYFQQSLGDLPLRKLGNLSCLVCNTVHVGLSSAFPDKFRLPQFLGALPYVDFSEALHWRLLPQELGINLKIFKDWSERERCQFEATKTVRELKFVSKLQASSNTEWSKNAPTLSDYFW